MSKQIHGRKEKASDTYLTPPALVKALGPFDLDPCCPPNMPWKTAKRMISLPEDGLTAQWKGRVWLNPPYSDVRPWVDKFVAHGSGIALVSAKSTDARWGQALLNGCHSAYWLAGRLLFHKADGSETFGKFLSNMLVAVSETDANILEMLEQRGYDGVLFRRVV